MSDEWDFYPALVDDQPASIFVDLGIAASAPISSHGIMGYLRIHMRQPRENGLSSEAEFHALVGLEDIVTEKISTSAGAIFVGRNTSSGNRDFYFYVTDATLFETSVAAAMASFPDYEFEVGSRPDLVWQTYFEFLYPSPKQRQCIENRRVCDSLEKHGDRIDRPRLIDHFAIFPHRSNCEAYVDFVGARGFAIREGHPSNDGKADWYVEFSRIDTPREIDDVTLELFEGAKERGGYYDGWGCNVVT